MNDFVVAINAVVPFFLLMAGGYILNRFRPMKPEFIAQVNGMVFTCFFPFIIFSNLYKMDRTKGFKGGMIAAVFAGIFIILFAALLITKKTVKDDSRRSVIVQGMFRSNVILFAIPLAKSVFGSDGAEASALVGSLVSPLFSVISVILFESFRGKKSSVPKLIKNTIINPIMIGAIAAVIVILTGIKFPSSVDGVIDQVSTMASCLALILLGMSLDFGAIRKNGSSLIIFTVIKMILIPAVALPVLLALNLSPAERFAAFCIFATPASITSYTFASNMGGDGELAGHIVFITTAVSVVTMFLWIFFLKRMGIF